MSSTTNKIEWIVVMSRSRKRALKFAEVDDSDKECSFCGRKEHECGGDHGDEMRDIVNQHRNRHRRF